MKSKRLLTAATAAVVLVCASPPDTEAKVKTTEVFLFKQNNACVHDVKEPPNFKISKKKDVAVWEFTNDGDTGSGGASAACGKAQDVIVCSYIAGQLRYDMFESCASTPTAGLTFNAPFPLANGQVLRMMCLGRTTTNQGKVRIDSADVGQLSACPATLPASNPKAHVIAIEIVP
jgi:hypothetical protein